MRPRPPAAGVDSSRPDSVPHWRRGDFSSPEASARIEQVLAVARVFPLPMLVASLTNESGMSLAARALAEDVVTAYAVVCAVVPFLTVLVTGWLLRATRVVHVVDLGFTTVLLHLMAPLPAPLVLVVFTLIAAAARWGSRATLVTGGVTLAAFRSDDRHRYPRGILDVAHAAIRVGAAGADSDVYGARRAGPHVLRSAGGAGEGPRKHRRRLVVCRRLAAVPQ